jgi:sterol desaturase/sphingolipid hydroxylase (fatty acid hydroxylase superfamily)
MGQGENTGGVIQRNARGFGRNARVPLIVGFAAAALLAEVLLRGGPLDRHIPLTLVRVSATRTIALVLLAGLFIPLEMAFARRAKRILRAGWRADVVYFFVNNFFASAGTLVAVGAVGLGLRALVPGAMHDAIVGQPAMLQFAEAFLLSEIAEYWAHRSMHAVPFLWRFHKVHHGITEMDWLASARLHPVDRALTRSSAFLPLFVLGFSHVTIGAFGLFAAVQALAVHANVRFTFGPFRYVLATPQYHHWHHDAAAATNKNFAAKLPLVDWLFGSLHMPRGLWPMRYGIDEQSPETYFGQLVWPFAPVPALQPVPVPAYE